MKKYIKLFIGILFLISCSTTDSKPDAYWNALLLNTGHLKDINDITLYQKEFLETIKPNYNMAEKKSLEYSKKIFDDWYKKDCSIKMLDVSGLNLPQDSSKTWELYIESFEDDIYLVVVVIFEGMDIKEYTVID